MVCRGRRWYGTRTGVGFEQRVERRRRGRRRRRWKWLPGLSTLAGFVARRTATSARSPPFPLRHITRQTDALPSTVRKNGPAQGVHLTGHEIERPMSIRRPPSDRQPVRVRRRRSSSIPGGSRCSTSARCSSSDHQEQQEERDSIEMRATIEHRLEPGRCRSSRAVLSTVPAGFPSSSE